MNLPCPTPIPEINFADVVRRLEPRLLELVPAGEIEHHLRRFARQLRLSAEIDAQAGKDAGL